ncbi:hypothetical protein POM88_041641 [Heracleum sosnowskyi]|uniref:Ubiquitin carboxyl-terminal hydrolase n=1 Tax=Heracleum sosnowskyi TaxID=360622 RepID=A0AAD8HEN0_9APIA|nr:hypothetical protein POM88_041641 [Heracleum sosnowskyi]
MFSRRLLVGLMPLALFAPNNFFSGMMISFITAISFCSYVDGLREKMRQSKAGFFFREMSFEGKKMIFFGLEHTVEMLIHVTDIILAGTFCLSSMLVRHEFEIMHETYVHYDINLILKVILIALASVKVILSKAFQKTNYGRMVDKKRVLPLDQIYDIPSTEYDTVLKYRAIGSEKESIVDRGLCGLLNVGSCCYVNSVIQCLAHTRSFARFFLEKPCHELETYGKLSGAVGHLLQIIWTPGIQATDPTLLKTEMARFVPQFAGNNQHDAQEFLERLLEGLSQDLSSVLANNSNVVDLFKGEFENSLSCLECVNTSKSCVPFLNLPVPIPCAKVSIYDCLKKIFGEEYLLGDNIWMCPACGKKRMAERRCRLSRVPEIFIFHLLRVKHLESLTMKVETPVSFPLKNFDVSEYAANGTLGASYELYAVINHFGSAENGHFTATVKVNESNKWFSFDDLKVSSVGERDIVSSAAYILFYKISRDSEHVIQVPKFMDSIEAPIKDISTQKSGSPQNILANKSLSELCPRTAAKVLSACRSICLKVFLVIWMFLAGKSVTGETEDQ